MLASVGYTAGDAYDWEVGRARNASTLSAVRTPLDAPLANEAIRHRVDGAILVPLHTQAAAEELRGRDVAFDTGLPDRILR